MWSPLTLRKRSTEGHDKDNDEDHDKDLGSSTRELHVQVQQETWLETMHMPVQGESELQNVTDMTDISL